MMHLSISIGVFEGMSDVKLRDCFPQNTPRQIREHLKALRDAGYEFLPACDDCDEKGACRGHHTEGK